MRCGTRLWGELEHTTRASVKIPSAIRAVRRWDGRPAASGRRWWTPKSSSNPRLEQTGASATGLLAVAPGVLAETGRDDITGAFTELVERLCRAVADAAPGERLWLGRIRAGVVALLAFLEQERSWARPLIAEQQELAVELGARRVQDALAEVLDAARGQVIIGSQIAPPTSVIAELLSCAVVSVIRTRMLPGDGVPLAGLASPLMEHVIEPYLTAGAQLADHARDPGRPAPPAGEAAVLPLRAHPRVILTLRVIASTPGLSSRQVGQRVNTGGKRHDISDLFTLLEQRGLIENTRLGRGARDRTAWRLTLYGRRAPELLADAPPDTRRDEQRNRRQRRPLPRQLSARPVNASARAARRAA